MSLQRERKPSDEVRAPAVPRGKAVIVTRYRKEVAKVALVNPDDLSMLEESHDLLNGLGASESEPPDRITRKALKLEDKPDPSNRIEDPEQIARLLEL